MAKGMVLEYVLEFKHLERLIIMGASNQSEIKRRVSGCHLQFIIGRELQKGGLNLRTEERKGTGVDMDYGTAWSREHGIKVFKAFEKLDIEKKEGQLDRRYPKRGSAGDT